MHILEINLIKQEIQKFIKIDIVELYKILDGGSKSYFPFGSVGNGDYMCFDLKKNNRVVLYINEIQKVYYLCDTFTQFIDGLTEG